MRKGMLPADLCARVTVADVNNHHLLTVRRYLDERDPMRIQFDAGSGGPNVLFTETTDPAGLLFGCPACQNIGTARYFITLDALAAAVDEVWQGAKNGVPPRPGRVVAGAL